MDAEEQQRGDEEVVEVHRAAGDEKEDEAEDADRLAEREGDDRRGLQRSARRQAARPGREEPGLEYPDEDRVGHREPDEGEAQEVPLGEAREALEGRNRARTIWTTTA